MGHQANWLWLAETQHHLTSLFTSHITLIKLTNVVNEKQLP